MALFFKSLKELSLFDLMMNVSAMIQVPLLIPLILGLFIKQTPKWAPWATVILGLFVSWFVKEIFTPQVIANWIGIDSFTPRESADMGLILTLGLHIVITAGFFVLTALFYRAKNESIEDYKHRVDFFKDLETPVIADDVQDDYDRRQREKLGTMVIFFATGMLLMLFIPNLLWGRLTFLGCACVLGTIGFLLKRSATNSKNV